MSLGARLLSLNRTVHIYVTLAAAGLLLFVAVSGFLLNHEEWFGGREPSSSRTESFELPADLVAAETLDKLAIVEKLRGRFADLGLVYAFEAEQDELRIEFRKPAQSVSVTVDRRTGQAQVLFEGRGPAGMIGDLHRVQHAGWWRWCMDASAVTLALGSVTGIILWASLPRRRRLGLALLVLGTAVTVGIYLLATP